VSLEIIERATGAPCPGAQCAPIFEPAWSSLVDKADDALRQARAVIRLHARWDQTRVSPTLRQHSCLPRWTIRRLYSCREPEAGREHETQLHDHRHRSHSIRGRSQRQLYVDIHQRITRVVDVTHNPFRDDGNVILHFARFGNYFPLHARHIGWDAAIDFAIEILDDLRAALLPPHLRGRHVLTIL